MNRDPIGEEGGINVYKWCFNNGVDNVDGLGEWVFGGCWLGCFLGLSASETAMLMGDVSHELLKNPAIATYVTQEMDAARNAYIAKTGSAVGWKKVKMAALKAIEKKAMNKAVLIVGAQAVGKELSKSLAKKDWGEDCDKVYPRCEWRSYLL